METLWVVFKASLIFQAHGSFSCSLFGSVYAYQKLCIFPGFSFLLEPQQPDTFAHIVSLRRQSGACLYRAEVSVSGVTSKAVTG